jgi:NAD+ kinase
MFSPGAEHETFSTPPSSPMPLSVDRNILDHPSLSRRSSRPSNLRIQQSLSDYKPDIVVDNQPSPDVNSLAHHAVHLAPKASTPLTAVPNRVNGHAYGGPMTESASSTDPALGNKSPRPPHLAADRLAHDRQTSPMRSPCFVHSHLQGPSFPEWLGGKQQKVEQEARIDGVPKADDVHPLGQGYPDGSLTEPAYENGYYQHEEEEETAGSLTKQLAETAVGVREMSKQLGETFVALFAA